MSKPLEPYQIGSGKRIGKYLEILMFQDYRYLHWHLLKIQQEMHSGSTKNRYHEHLEWLVAQGESRVSKKLCPICNQQPITQFSVLGSDQYGYSMSVEFSSCDDDNCRNRVKAMCPGKLPVWLPARFSRILHFTFKSDQKLFVQLLRQVFRLPKRLEANHAFQFFNE